MPASIKLSVNQKGRACRQAGFAPIIIILIVLLFSAGIIGGAYYFKTTLEKPKISDQKPTTPKVTPTSTSADETVNWKTYINKKFNYSIKYPSELIVGNGLDPESAFDYVDNLYLYDKNGNFLDISHRENPNNLSAKDWLNSEDGKSFNYNNSHYKSLDTSSLAWYIFDPPLTFSLDSAAFKWGLFNNADIFLVGNKTKISDDIIEQILSTFKFLD